MSNTTVANTACVDIRTYNMLIDKARMFDQLCKNPKTVFEVGTTRFEETRTIMTNQAAKVIIDEVLEDSIKIKERRLVQTEALLKKANKRWYHRFKK
jgi:hypothetical protein